jgi:hypothetical protein
MIKSVKYILLLVLVSNSCIEPYWPDIEGLGSVLAVDALISDSPENQYVVLSSSSPVDRQIHSPVTGARVLVEDDEGNQYEFYEINAGRYIPYGFNGVPGRKYKLDIYLEPGKHYGTEFQSLITSELFDTIFYEVEEQPTTDPRYSIKGARFYLNAYTQESDTRYLIFQLEETFKYHVDFVLEYIEMGQGLQKVEFPPSTLCYKTSSLNGFYLYKKHRYTTGHPAPLPLHFVDFDTKRFFERYSLLIRQITVSEEIFDYYYQVNQQQNSGSMYATQPYNIIGNVKCLSDPTEEVLGSFIVGGVREKRKFYSRPRRVTFNFPECFPMTDGVGLLILRGGSPTNPLYFTLFEGSLANGQEECFFCHSDGGVSEKPEFWED